MRMSKVLFIIIGIIITGIGVLLCFSCCYVASKSDEYWEKKKNELENKNDRQWFFYMFFY